MVKRGGSLLERFFRRFAAPSDEACWEWAGTKFPFGHGYLLSGGAKTPKVAAHRLSYELFVGPIPRGLFVLHHCDNPSCVNPAHLYIGTNADNMRDVRVRGRQRGERHPRHRLTEHSVALVRQFLSRHPAGRGRKGGQCLFLARWFGVRRATITHAASGRNWGHIPRAAC